MKELKFGQYNFNGSPAIEVNIKENGITDTELKIKAIEHLMSTLDLKNDFDGDGNRFNKAVERLLLSAADIIGYESYYWGHVPKEETKYNAYEELVVSQKSKIDLLEVLVKSLKAEIK